MIDIRRKKVKAIYFNAFHCPECGLELYRDNITLTTYPPQNCYYCECGFRTASSQTPGIEYEFEDEDDLSPAYPDRIVDAFCEIPLSQNFGDLGITTEEMLESVKAIQDAFADAMGYSYV